MADRVHYWVKIKRPDGDRYFVRFTRHHPAMQWEMIRSYQQAYCFASVEDANRVAAQLKAVGVDATVAYTKTAPAPPPPPPLFSFESLWPPQRLQPWIDKILEVGSALGKQKRERIDAGYRALAREHHPDNGGAVADMQVLNDACSWLRANYDPLLFEDVPF